jgi:hypothetical protein
VEAEELMKRLNGTVVPVVVHLLEQAIIYPFLQLLLPPIMADMKMVLLVTVYPIAKV